MEVKYMGDGEMSAVKERQQDTVSDSGGGVLGKVR